MRFSIWPEASDDWRTLVSRVRDAEAAGWDGVWIADHFIPNTPDATGDVNECFALLAALAAAVPRMRI
ncbi:MAG: LLM class flavin-dependent oxidoreductase, partial [Acidimicrobiales bacterium]